MVDYDHEHTTVRMTDLRPPGGAPLRGPLPRYRAIADTGITRRSTYDPAVGPVRHKVAGYVMHGTRVRRWASCGAAVVLLHDGTANGTVPWDPNHPRACRKCRR